MEEDESSGQGTGDREIVAVSYEKSTVEDEKETAKLRVILRDEFQLEETHETAMLLKDVLFKLQELISTWVVQVATKKKLPSEVIAKASGKLCTSGSYRLGVHGSSSDIDALCVVPRFVDRDEDFFGDLLETLKKNPDITDLRGIREAHVPLIKMKYLNVDIDLLFARVRFETLDGNVNNLQDDTVLKDCDDQTIDSLNACRNNDMIITLVPNQENFKVTLKCIKVWAKRRDLYSNKIGFFGGISWAILVAKICQLYPHLAPNRLLEKFFSVFYKWKWEIPVVLCEFREPKGVTLTRKNWSKLGENDQKHIMPIITPAFPSINSTFNVSKTTRRIITSEFHRAARIARKVNAHIPGYTWMALFTKYDFFKEFIHYIRIDALSQVPSEHLRWEGFIESKLRMLIQELEVREEEIAKIRPYTRAFNLPDSGYKCCTSFLFGLKFREQIRQPGQECVIDLRNPVFNFCSKIRNLLQYLDRVQTMRLNHVTRDKLPMEVFEDGVRPHYPSLKRKLSTKPNPLLDLPYKIKADNGRTATSDPRPEAKKQ